jgi:hypothetical protein
MWGGWHLDKLQFHNDSLRMYIAMELARWQWTQQSEIITPLTQTVAVNFVSNFNRLRGSYELASMNDITQD